MTTAAPTSSLSPLALGLWRAAKAQLPCDRLAALIRAAVDAGITTFDLATVYGNYRCEQDFGAALSIVITWPSR